MGYVMMSSQCINCGRLFSYNPHKVPSVRVKGVREPVCRSCIEAANTIRKERGILPLHYHPDAYEPLPEEEL